jgi:hypothetical protein
MAYETPNLFFRMPNLFQNLGKPRNKSNFATLQNTPLLCKISAGDF